MNVAFTICSNNYLAHAKTLGDSFLVHHPDFTFIIGLVDKYSEELDYSTFKNFTVIPVDELNILNFGDLNKKYTITELNTAVKPSYFHYLFQKFQPEKVLYIDPDILVLSRFNEVITILDKQNIVITPHIYTPIDDEFAPTDYHTLRGGVFNLGFIALSNYEKVTNFLTWWNERVVKYGFANFALSMFYDQLWINYVPAFYEDYHILKHPGYNMANWNLHERSLSQNKQDAFLVNDTFQLRFFHFSSYNFKNPEVICSYLSRYNFDMRPDLRRLFNIYRNLLVQNKVEAISKIKVHFYPDLGKSVETKVSIYRRVYYRLRKTMRVLIKGN